MNTVRAKVLAVDDHEDNLFVLDALLSSETLELLLASSADEAMVLLETHDVAVALLDVQMPVVDGYQLATWMRASERLRRIPILFLTAGAEDESEQFRAADAGPVEFFLTPVDTRLLRKRMAELLKAHET